MSQDQSEHSSKEPISQQPKSDPDSKSSPSPKTKPSKKRNTKSSSTSHQTPSKNTSEKKPQFSADTSQNPKSKTRSTASNKKHGSKSSRKQKQKNRKTKRSGSRRHHQLKVLCISVPKKRKSHKRKKVSKRSSRSLSRARQQSQSTGEILEQLMTNPELFAEFEAFLKTEYAEENLQCYKAIWEFKQLKDPSKRYKVAKQICDTFFGISGEPELITIPAEQVERYKNVLKDKSTITLDLFDEIQGELGFILRSRWVRFSAANDGKN